mgnify:CR=1 FL=1|jgi:hypothetical protein
MFTGAQYLLTVEKKEVIPKRSINLPYILIGTLTSEVSTL